MSYLARARMAWGLRVYSKSWKEKTKNQKNPHTAEKGNLGKQMREEGQTKTCPAHTW